MKQLISLLVLVLLYSGCDKRKTDIVPPNAGNSESTINIVNVDSMNQADQPDLSNNILNSMEPQDFIKNYASRMLDSYDDKRTLAFQIDGQFTGSRNKEIIGFYEIYRPGITRKSICCAYCFVFNSAGDEIENVYAINYLTGEFSDTYEAKTGLDDNLGVPIIWKNRKIGCVGDFNKNGKDELYLFILSGISFTPNFYEFNGTEFTEIIDLEWAFEVSIVGTDPEEGIIVLKETVLRDETGIDLTEKLNTYIWNESHRQYIILSSQVKKYRWNRNLREYEEIE